MLKTDDNTNIENNYLNREYRKTMLHSNNCQNISYNNLKTCNVKSFNEGEELEPVKWLRGLPNGRAAAVALEPAASELAAAAAAAASVSDSSSSLPRLAKGQGDHWSKPRKKTIESISSP